jgi:hypothetical protein
VGVQEIQDFDPLDVAGDSEQVSQRCQSFLLGKAALDERKLGF